MTPKSFWLIFIKVLGIFLIIDSVAVVPQSISSMVTILMGSGFNSGIGIALSISAVILTLLIYYLILKYCIFKPEWLINKLQLDKGFDQEILDINIHKSTVLSLASIILGGLLFLDNLPTLCLQVFNYYQEDALSGRFGDKPSTGALILYLVKTIAGYWIMTNHNVIGNIIDRLSSSEK